MTDLIKVERLTKDGIVDYYKDFGKEYFDCGEGYYENATTITKPLTYNALLTFAIQCYSH